MLAGQTGLHFERWAYIHQLDSCSKHNVRRHRKTKRRSILKKDASVSLDELTYTFLIEALPTSKENVLVFVSAEVSIMIWLLMLACFCST